jgi:hypothetical protein
MNFAEVRVLVVGDYQAKIAVIEGFRPSCFYGI